MPSLLIAPNSENSVIGKDITPKTIYSRLQRKPLQFVKKAIANKTHVHRKDTIATNVKNSFPDYCLVSFSSFSILFSLFIFYSSYSSKKLLYSPFALVPITQFRLTLSRAL